MSFLTHKSFDAKTGVLLSHSLELSQKFAEADEIILAAPFWEFMFPAIVNCYFEQVSCVGTTFKYTPTGGIWLCKANSFKYIYTAGAYLTPEDKLCEKYLKRLTKFYGIKSFSSILVDGLDIDINDAEDLVSKMCNKITNSTLYELKNK